jgi:ATP-dependent RNA helicase DeaD
VPKEIPSGIEICEKQLFHLASNIAQTEINHEIDPYLPAIGEVLKDFDKDQLIKKFFSVEFSRFFNYYKKAKDLNVPHGTVKEGSSSPEKSENSVRYFINLGRKDGLAWMDLKDFVREVTGLGKDEVFHVDTMDTFSFFNTDAAHEKRVNETFQGVFFHDRAIEIERSDDRGSRGKFKGGKGSGKKSKKGKSFGGDRRGNSDFESSGRPKRGKKQESSATFKGKSRRRGERPDVPGTRGKRRRR